VLTGHTPKGYASCGFRRFSPSTLLRRIGALLPEAGVTRLAVITGLDRIGIPTVLAVRPMGQTLSVVAGKGVCLDEARASAAMEAIEFFSAEAANPSQLRCPGPDVGMPWVQPTDGVPLRRHALVRSSAPFSWIFGVELMRATRCAVPVELVTLAEPRDPLSPFLQTTNGLASGAVRIEALLAGLLEVVERDACGCWKIAEQVAGVAMPRVRLETLLHMRVARGLLQRFADADVLPIVYDCSVDTRIPVYLVRLIDLARRHVGIFSGSGAHLDPEVALVRALTEAAQSRAVYVAGSRDDLSSRAFAQLRAHDSPRIRDALIAQRAYVDASDRQSAATVTFETDCQYVIQRLASVGIQRVVVVDLTPPRFQPGVAVVRVLVPGLIASGVPVDFQRARLTQFLHLAAA
jgi:ribosomal protein S12 methylthiotransferase accessory factor